MLPFKGTIQDQPNKIIEVFQIIEGIKNKKEEQERKKQERKAQSREARR